VTPRWVPGTLVVALLAGSAAALPAAAHTPPPPGTPISPPPTGDVLPTPPPTAPPPTEPVPVIADPTTPPPTTVAASEPEAPASTPPPAAPRPAPAPTAPPPQPLAPAAPDPPPPSGALPPGPAPDTAGSAPLVRGRIATVVAGSGAGLDTVDPPLAIEDVPVPLPAPEAPQADGAPDRTPPTQRRLAPRPPGDDVAAPAPATASARSRDQRGPFRRDVLPLALLGGAVALAYVACLQLAEHRRQRRGAAR
jgi:hypothetical protein